MDAPSTLCPQQTRPRTTDIAGPLRGRYGAHLRVGKALGEAHHEHQVSLDDSDAGQMLAVLCHLLLLLVLLLLLLVLDPLDLLL